MRFGIGMNTDHTLEEMGQHFSVTRERIRQIEAKALRKLKHEFRIPGTQYLIAEHCPNTKSIPTSADIPSTQARRRSL